MNLIRNVTIIACYIGIAISILDFLTPSEKLRKQIKLIFSLVFLIAIASPILKGNISLELPAIQPVHESDEYMEVENTFNESLEFYFKKNIKQALTQKLEVNGLSPKEISVIVNKDENNCISISEVKIVLAVQDEKLIQKAREIIQNELGNVAVDVSEMEEIKQNE